MRAALNTQVMTTEVVPLPKLRAGLLLKDAQRGQRKKRAVRRKRTLSRNLKAAREQLQLAGILGYAKKKDYKPLYKELDEIEDKCTGGKRGAGGFHRIRNPLSDWF